MQALPRLPSIHASEPWQSLVDAVATGVLVLDHGGAVLHANPSAVLFLAPDRSERAPLDRLLAVVGLEAAVALGDGTSAAVQIELTPGRVIECSIRPLPGTGHVLTLVDVSLQARAVQLAQHDPLTGLANRTELRHRLDERLGRPNEAGSGFGVLCIDLDRFKAVNDSLGHPVGDALLRKVADRLRAGVRPKDLVARMGGDEFAIVQADASSVDTTAEMARRLVEMVSRPYAVEGHILNIGASVGVVRAPVDGSDPDDLLKKADLALYRAKADGRGTFRFFEAGMDSEAQLRRALEFDLRKALAMREFSLVYQPQIILESGKVSSFEALLRWSHPRRGSVPPAEFIPLAEELGLIVPIGEWILLAACREAASWPADVGLAINLSPLQLRSPRLVERVAAAFAATGLEPSRLEIEITEGALMDNTPLVLDVLHRLHALGVRVSMDDFGTGYSSLSYLQSFPFDRIKIDQSFVRGADERERDAAIVRAIAGLGASLGIRTTAEGVETHAQLDRIRRDGCTDVQGFLTGRPLPPEAAALLAAGPDAGLDPVPEAASPAVIANDTNPEDTR